MSEKPDKTPGARAGTPNDVPGPAPEAGLPGTAAEPPPELPSPTPEERVATLENEKAELHDRMLRIAAEFDNWKKRSRKEMSDTETRSKEQVLREFLEIIDNLERATASWADNGDIVSSTWATLEETRCLVFN